MCISLGRYFFYFFLLLFDFVLTHYLFNIIRLQSIESQSEEHALRTMCLGPPIADDKDLEYLLDFSPFTIRSSLTYAYSMGWIFHTWKPPDVMLILYWFVRNNMLFELSKPFQKWSFEYLKPNFNAYNAYIIGILIFINLNYILIIVFSFLPNFNFYTKNCRLRLFYHFYHYTSKVFFYVNSHSLLYIELNSAISIVSNIYLYIL